MLDRLPGVRGRAANEPPPGSLHHVLDAPLHLVALEQEHDLAGGEVHLVPGEPAVAGVERRAGGDELRGLLLAFRA